jgi:ribose transport system substrate-binding protein
VVKYTRQGFAGLLAIAAVTVAACSSSAAPSSGSSPAAQGTSGAGSLGYAQQQLTSHESNVGWPTLASGPKPASGKTVYIISSYQALEGNIRVVDGLQQAVTELGWKSVVLDGKGTTDAQSAAFQQAVNEHAYAIFDVFIDTNSIGAAMAAVTAAKIPVVSVTSGSPTTGANAVVAEVGSVPFNYQMGELEAYYAIAANKGKVNALIMEDNSFTTAPPIAQGADAVLKQCSTCKVDAVVTFAAADLVTGMAGLVQTNLQRYPDVNYVFLPYDAAASFAATGIQQAGSSAKIVSTGGNLPNLAMIRQGQTEVATVAEPLSYFSYLAVNDLIRYEGGAKPLPFNAPLKILMASNLPPAGQAWNGDSSFAGSFRTLWGLG